MDEDAIARAADIIARHRLSGMPIGPLPEDCRPRDEGEGYAVQEALHARLAAAGLGRQAGHKVGCTNAAMQELVGIDHACAGGILAGGVFREHATFRFADFVRPGAETEIAVRLGRDLGPEGAPYDRASVAAGLDAVMAAIELVDDRYQDFRGLGSPTLIADDFFNAGCVLGPEVQGQGGLDLAAVRARTVVNGEVFGEGLGSNLMGHPLEVLAWLANSRAARGQGLAAGEIVLLGTIVPVRWLEQGDAVEIELEGLGAVRAAFL